MKTNFFSRLTRLSLGNMASIVLFMALFTAGARSGIGTHEPTIPQRLKDR